MDYQEIEKRVKEMLITRLNLPLKPEEINAQTQIFGPAENSLGLDSVDGLESVVGMGNEFGVAMTEEEGPKALENIGSISNFILCLSS